MEDDFLFRTILLGLWGKRQLVGANSSKDLGQWALVAKLQDKQGPLPHAISSELSWPQWQVTSMILYMTAEKQVAVAI